MTSRGVEQNGIECFKDVVGAEKEKRMMKIRGLSGGNVIEQNE